MSASTTILEENFRKLEVVTAGLPKEYLGLFNTTWKYRMWYTCPRLKE